MKALERGLVYDEDNPQISLQLAETWSGSTKAIRRWRWSTGTSSVRPIVEAYELLAKVLKSLESREGDHSSAGSGRPARCKNVPLQYYPGRSLPRDRPDRQGRGALQRASDLAADAPDLSALVASLLKRKKAADLLKVISEASLRPESQEAIKPQLQAAAADDAMAEAMLDEGHQADSRLRSPRCPGPPSSHSLDHRQ